MQISHTSQNFDYLLKIEFNLHICVSYSATCVKGDVVFNFK